LPNSCRCGMPSSDDRVDPERCTAVGLFMFVRCVKVWLNATSSAKNPFGAPWGSAMQFISVEFFQLIKASVCGVSSIHSQCSPCHKCALITCQK
jgi:hypothetical protein